MWIEGASGFIGNSDNLAAELHGILNGIRRLQAIGVQEACLYSDSIEAIRVVSGELDWEHRHANLISSIKDYWNRSAVRIQHILREGNSVADALARRGAQEVDFFTTWTFPPDDVAHLLSVDASDMMYPRL